MSAAKIMHWTKKDWRLILSTVKSSISTDSYAKFRIWCHKSELHNSNQTGRIIYPMIMTAEKAIFQEKNTPMYKCKLVKDLQDNLGFKAVFYVECTSIARFIDSMLKRVKEVIKNKGLCDLLSFKKMSSYNALLLAAGLSKILDLPVLTQEEATQKPGFSHQIINVDALHKINLVGGN
ncbi:hypothetical protein G9A89_000171, partial [Geosiphon pyriformis]